MRLTKHLIRCGVNGGEVWFNTLSGAVDLLTREEVDTAELAAAGSGTETQTRSLLERLKSRGYLFADRRAEKAAVKDLVARYGDGGPAGGAVSLIVCPTYSCNLRCVYCFERQGHPRLPQSVLSVSAASRLLEAFDRIRRLSPGRDYSLGLFGGEPLLPATRGAVTAVLAGARERSLPVVIVSNGVNVASYLPLLGRYAAVIRVVQLTIDGTKPVHDRRRPHPGGRGSFDEACQAVDLLLQNHIPVALRVNIDRSNIADLPRLTRVANKRGWTGNRVFSASLAPVRDHLGSGAVPNVTPEAELLSLLIACYRRDPASERLFGFRGFQSLGPIGGLGKDSQRRAPRVRHCEANLGGFWVGGPDGLLYACPEAIGRPELAVGRFAPTFEIWEEKSALWTSRNVDSLDECRDCRVAPLCGGGCAYASLMGRGAGGRQGCRDELEQALTVFLRERAVAGAGMAA